MSAEIILQSLKITPSTKFHSYTYLYKAMVKAMEKYKEEAELENEKLREALKELLPLADSGYQHNSANGGQESEEFLQMDRTALMNARDLIK